AQTRLESQMTPMPIAVEFVNDLPTRIISVIINPAKIHEVIESKLALCPLANVHNLFRVRHPDGDFAAEFTRSQQQIAEAFAQLQGVFFRSCQRWIEFGIAIKLEGVSANSCRGQSFRSKVPKRSGEDSFFKLAVMGSRATLF